MASLLVVSSLLGLSIAQTTSLTIPFIGFDAQTVAASIVSANSDGTTFQLACYGSTDCGLFPAQTLVSGPSTYNMDESDPNTDFTATQDCVIASTGAVCKETAGGSEANFPGSSTETYDATEIGSMLVMVTAGAEKLSGSAQASATGSGSSASAGNGASKTTASATQATGSGAASGSPSASKSGSAPATTSTGAAAVNAIALGGGLVGAAAGLVGGLLL
ncbi:Nn.00g031590.m01.CDS01 [Neocucurbitaria sp. VM-36]